MAPESVIQVADGIADHIAARRRTLRFVESPRFRDAFDRAAPSARSEMVELVRKDDQDGLEGWVRSQLRQGYEMMPIRELRAVGRKLKVANYGRIPRASLIVEIERHAKEESRPGPAPAAPDPGYLSGPARPDEDPDAPVGRQGILVGCYRDIT